MRLAFRSRLLDTVVATTGSATLARTTTGYTRAAGSFVTDGFEPGMEFLEAGFPTNGYQIVKSVAAGTLLTEGALTASGAAAGRSLTAGIPEGRAWDGSTFTPTAGRWYIEEALVPGTHVVRTMPMASAYAENDGLYVITAYGLSGKGAYALDRFADAVLSMFTPGTSFTLSDGTAVRIPAELGPTAGQITPIDGGLSSAITIEIPYLANSLNTIAA